MSQNWNLWCSNSYKIVCHYFCFITILSISFWSFSCALFTRPSSQAGGSIALGFDHLHCNLWDPHSTLFLYSVRNMADYKDQLEVSVICSCLEFYIRFGAIPNYLLSYFFIQKCPCSVFGLDVFVPPLFPSGHLVWPPSANTICQCHSASFNTEGKTL